MYVPNQVPTDPALLPGFLRVELQRIQQAWGSANQSVRLDPLYEAPQKVFEGLVVLADGTSWNPGSGAGFYGYRNSGWRFLG